MYPLQSDRARLLIDHSGHSRHAALIHPDDVRMIKHSGTVDTTLPAWEGQVHE